MIDQTQTREMMSRQYELAEGINLEDVGIGLVAVKVGGKTVVQPGSGASGEIFVGVADDIYMNPVYLPKIEESFVSASGTIPLTRVPAKKEDTMQISVWEMEDETIGTSYTVETSGAPTAGSTCVLKLSSNPDLADYEKAQLVFAEDDANKKMRIQYTYLPSALETLTVAGSMPVGGWAVNSQRVVKVFKRGFIGTSCYDNTKDWTNAQLVKLSEGGIFTPAASETEALKNVQVMNTPSVDNGFLVLDLM